MKTKTPDTFAALVAACRRIDRDAHDHDQEADEMGWVAVEIMRGSIKAMRDALDAIDEEQKREAKT